MTKAEQKKRKREKLITKCAIAMFRWNFGRMPDMKSMEKNEGGFLDSSYVNGSYYCYARECLIAAGVIRREKDDHSMDGIPSKLLTPPRPTLQ